jgi:hypothetical protein
VLRRDLALVIALILAGAGAFGLLLPSPEQRIATEADAAARSG